MKKTVTSTRYFHHVIGDRITILGSVNPMKNNDRALHINRICKQLTVLKRRSVYCLAILDKITNITLSSIVVLLSILWYQPTTMLCYLDASLQKVFWICAWWRRISSARLILIIDHDVSKTSITNHCYEVDRLVCVGPNVHGYESCNYAYACAVESEYHLCDNGYVVLQGRDQREIFSTYPVSLKTFIKVHAPTMLLSIDQFIVVNPFDTCGIMQALELMNDLRLYYPNIVLVVMIAHMIDYTKFVVIKHYVQRVGLSSHVYFHHSYADIGPLLARMHLLIYPFKKVQSLVHEACAYNVPVLAQNDFVIKHDKIIKYQVGNHGDMVQCALQGLTLRGYKLQSAVQVSP